MNDSTVTRRSALTVLGGSIMALAVAALPAVPAFADAPLPEPSTWRETMAAARAVELSPSQRQRSLSMLLDVHRAVMASAGTGGDLEQQMGPLRDRLVAEDRDEAYVAFSIEGALLQFVIAESAA